MNLNELLERYSLKTRQSLYNRLKALDLTLQKDSTGKSYATPEQIKLLDEVNEHIKGGGNLNNFTETVITEIDTPNPINTSLDSEIVPLSSDEKTLYSDEKTPVQVELFDLVGAIATIAKSQHSPLQNLRDLQEAADNEWILTTAQVHQLTGNKPSGSQWVRGSFRFIRDGKIGAQAGWKVEKVQ